MLSIIFFVAGFLIGQAVVNHFDAMAWAKSKLDD